MSCYLIIFATAGIGSRTQCCAQNNHCAQLSAQVLLTNCHGYNANCQMARALTVRRLRVCNVLQAILPPSLKLDELPWDYHSSLA